ncbi:MAG: hypothetical protein GY944_23750, partial [bacterium]|nr:hypothetical protein [bacterium]
AHFARGLELAPRRAEVHNELGELYAERKQWPAARARFEAALRERPDFAAARRNLEHARGK